jgi:catechol 2,3-dioxygenase-like lactoylglutathione lyase family enzyme
MSMGSAGNLLVMVSDLQKSVGFYRDTLGLKMTGGIPGEFAFFEWGGITLALRETDESIAKCLCEISFSVSDVRATFEKLSNKGVLFTKPPRAITSNESQEMLATDFRDPDGHILSITGWVQKQSDS